MPHRSATAVPTKTSAGHEELLHRVLKLGPRHRTMLLLVDGKRNHAEVLRLSEEAGVPPSHFDELLALGLLSLPALPPEAFGSPTAPTAPLAGGWRAPVDVDLSPAGTVLSMLERLALPLEGMDTLPAADAPPPRRRLRPAPRAAARPAADTRAWVQLELDHGLPETAAAPLDTGAPELPELDADLRQARDRLFESLVDAPLFSPRTLMRLRDARSRVELIELTAIVTEHLGAAGKLQRQGAEAIHLDRARQLLGMTSREAWSDPAAAGLQRFGGAEA